MTQHTARVALVGDRSANVLAHARIPVIIEALLAREGIALDPYWIATQDADDCDLAGFDAVWATPGSPYESFSGAIGAIRTARERGIPFLGTCGGFQHAVIEYARDVCGLVGAGHAEYAEHAEHARDVRGLARAEHAEVTPDAGELLIVPLECSLKGHEEAVMVVPGTLAAKILGPGRRTERYNCSYGLNPEYLEALTDGGLRFSGFDDSGAVRIMELPGHPFYVATLFQPERQDDRSRPHPVIRAFAAAAAERAAAGRGARLASSSR